MRSVMILALTAVNSVALVGCDNDVLVELFGDRAAGIEELEIPSVAERVEFIERGWLPGSLPESARIQSFARDHVLDASMVSFNLDEPDALRLADLIQPIDWSRFPGLDGEPSSPAEVELPDGSVLRAGMTTTRRPQLVSGETCENDVYWRYTIMEDYSGFVGSSVYQPGECPAEEVPS
jgi:hypothetical protein